jgi:hypothetical protein
LSLSKAKSEISKRWATKPGAVENLTAAQAVFTSAKEAFDAEKKRIISSIKPAPAGSRYKHPTPEQLLFVAAESPENFDDAGEFIFVPKDHLLKRMEWVRDVEAAINRGDQPFLAINHCIGFNVASIDDGYLVSTDGRRTALIFDTKNKILTMWDEGKDGILFDCTDMDSIAVCNKYYLQGKHPKTGKMCFRKVTGAVYDDDYLI